MTTLTLPPPAPEAQPRRHRRRRPVRRGGRRLLAIATATPLLVAATVDVLRVVPVGPMTALGAATVVEVALAAVALLATRRFPRHLLRRLAPFGALLGWALVSTAWHVPAVDGAQNGLVYLLFGVLALAAATLAASGRDGAERLLDRLMWVVTGIGLALAVTNIGPKGWPQWGGRHPAWWYVNPRPFALLGLVPIAWHLARWYHGRRWDMLAVMLWVAAIFASLSRTATATAMLLVAAVVGLHLRRGRHAERRGATIERVLLAAVPVAAIAGAIYFQPFSERLVERGRTVSGGTVVSDARVKDSGRLNIWTAVLASTMKAPVLGQGLGTANAAISEAYEAVGHPHNDYLRVWHDLGLVGLACLVASLAVWFRALFRDWRWSQLGAADGGRLELAALLALVGLALGMVTDNSLVYPFVMAPAGVVVGAGLGGGARAVAMRRRSRRRPADAPAPDPRPALAVGAVGQEAAAAAQPDGPAERRKRLVRRRRRPER